MPPVAVCGWQTSRCAARWVFPGVLSAPQWGFYDVLFSHTNKDLALKPEDKRTFSLSQPYGTYVMENVLFKISFPAEFHAQTACEAAVTLHPQVVDRLHDIERIVITTHESAIRIISKVGPLANAATRSLPAIHDRRAAGLRHAGGRAVRR